MNRNGYETDDGEKILVSLRCQNIDGVSERELIGLLRRIRLQQEGGC